MTDNVHIDWFPLDPDEHDAQLAALRRRLEPAPKRILDIGAGDGRLARPLAEDGHHVVAIDRDPQAVAICTDAGIDARLADALDPGALESIEPPFDAALCLGNTLLEFADPDAAIALLQGLERLLAPGGFLAIDAFAHSLWREVACGNWQEGLAPDADMQLVWAEADNVIALRVADAVDDDSWTLTSADKPLRLWSSGELALLARAAGWAKPTTHPDEHLILLTPIPQNA